MESIFAYGVNLHLLAVVSQKRDALTVHRETSAEYLHLPTRIRLSQCPDPRFDARLSRPVSWCKRPRVLPLFSRARNIYPPGYETNARRSLSGAHSGDTSRFPRIQPCLLRATRRRARFAVPLGARGRLRNARCERLNYGSRRDARQPPAHSREIRESPCSASVGRAVGGSHSSLLSLLSSP